MDSPYRVPQSGPSGGPGVLGPWTRPAGGARKRAGLVLPASAAAAAAVFAHCILPLL